MNLEGSNDFQQRIPNPTIHGYHKAVTELFAPYNHDLLNGFTMLLNGINNTYVEGKRFTNPLREIMKDSQLWGTTERHVVSKWFAAHSYAPDTECLLKMELPEYREWFYSVSRPRRYEFSWPVYEMQRAFSEPDGYGFNELLNSTIDAQISSNEYDQMNEIVELFAIADANQPLFRENLTAAPTDKATAQELLVKIRAAAGRMKFPTVMYNQLDVPVFENPETLVLWITPETNAYIDVMALADLFNMEKAEVKYRVIEIPEFPIPNVYAALTSEDFLFAREIGYGVEPPFYNPETRTFKYYLHDSEMLGINPLANCVLFTTDAQTVRPTVTATPTGLAFEPATGDVFAGGTFQLKLDLQGTVDPATGTPFTVQPDTALFEVAATRDGEALALNSRTFVDAYGKLHVQKTGIEAGDEIVVSAKSVYINPSGETQSFEASFTGTAIDPPQPLTKECAVETDPYIQYTDETVETPASE